MTLPHDKAMHAPRLAGTTQPIVAALALATLSLSALLWSWRAGALLLYGDAEAHLNIARRVFDSRTPGLRQVGTVWLPWPHLLMAPFARVDALWHTGLAGAIPNGICYVLAGLFLYSAAGRLYGTAGAVVALAAFALNPNLLYLQSTPMTEPMFLSAISALFYFAVRFTASPSLRWAAASGASALLASWTRYESWLLLPCVAWFFFSTGRGVGRRAALVFALVSGIGPLLWVVHNWWWWNDALAFLHGTYATRAGRYPGDGDWLRAAIYYAGAVELCSGWPLALLGLTGLLMAWRRPVGKPLLLLVPVPLFYVWTIHSSGIRVFVPHLYPYASYNTRYGIEALPLLAIATGAIVPFIPWRRQLPSVALISLFAVSPWLKSRGLECSACWREARDTSAARRAWTHQSAAFLREHYRAGEGILMSFGDLCGALREARIPLRESLTAANGEGWHAAMSPSGSARGPLWALTASSDAVARFLDRSGSATGRYQNVHTIRVEGAPTVQVWRLNQAAVTGQWQSLAAPPQDPHVAQSNRSG
jgi:hypothetical protein